MKQHRRHFLKKLTATSAVAALSPMALEASSQEKSLLTRNFPKSATELKNIRIGLIGAGGMGVEDTQTALQHLYIELVAVCDLYKGRLDAAKNRWGSQLFVTQDYKELLKRKAEQKFLNQFAEQARNEHQQLVTSQNKKRHKLIK